VELWNLVMGDLLLWSCPLPSSGECHSQLQARINCFRFPHNDPFLPSSSLLPLLILLLLFLLPASPLHFFLPLLSFILFPPFTSLLPFIHPSLSLPPSLPPTSLLKKLAHMLTVATGWMHQMDVPM